MALSLFVDAIERRCSVKITVDESMFIQRFQDYGRMENFSRAGLRALFAHLTELEDYSDEYELDVIALCCDFAEVSVEEALRDTGCETIEDLEGETTVLHVDDETIIYQSY